MDAQAEQRLADDALSVWRHRYQEARMAGLEHLEACAFAQDNTDLAEIRQLVKHGCPPGLIARIVL